MQFYTFDNWFDSFCFDEINIKITKKKSELLEQSTFLPK